MSNSNKLVTEKNGSRYGRMIHPWLRKKADMILDSPSRRDGMTYEEELSKRQQGGAFIFDLVSLLTHSKGEHGLSGVAATLLNRFFNVHSFKRYDFRDVAAACVFLAGKNEDAPKKLKYVVNHLWQLKFPHHRQFLSEQHFMDVCSVVTLLEEILLKSIAFDVNVDLPHQHVLKLMRDVEKGRNVYKDMVKTAYYMATDVLIITDWSIRYSCASIATACVNIAAFFHNLVIEDIVPLEIADQWFRFQDQTMTRSEVDAMTKEFLEIYSCNPQLHIGSLKKIDPLGKVKIIGKSPPQMVSSLSTSGSSSNLKKIDLESYKGRQKAPASTSESTSARPSFLPDVKNQKVVEQKLLEHKTDQNRHNNHHNSHRQSSSIQNYHHNSAASSSSSSTNHSINHHKPGSSNNRIHQKPHEESRSLKRSVGYEDNNSSKKTRTDYTMTIVSSSLTTSTLMENGYFAKTKTEEATKMSAYALGVSQMLAGLTDSSPLMSVPSQKPSAYQQMCMEYENKKRIPPLMEPRHPISSTQQISPPDESSPPVSSMILPPPPLPPVLPPRRIDEIEDGELV